MAYCTITDVRALNPKRTYDADSKPTETQVESFIDRIADEIDVVISGHGLSTPVASPQAFVDHLKQVNAYGAAALAEMAMFPEAAGSPGGSPHGDRLWKMYRAMMAPLARGEFPASLTDGAGPSSFFERHPATEPTESHKWREPKFKKDKEF